MPTVEMRTGGQKVRTFWSSRDDYIVASQTNRLFVPPPQSNTQCWFLSIRFEVPIAVPNHDVIVAISTRRDLLNSSFESIEM